MENKLETSIIEMESSDEYESKICKIMTYEDLLQPVPQSDENFDDNYACYCGTLAYVFDVDHTIIGRLANLDYFAAADPIMKDMKINYIQWINITPNSYHNPIDEVLSILFNKKDPVYGEPYENSSLLTNTIKDHVTRVAKEHGSLVNYLEWVSERLWRNKYYLSHNYEYYYRKCLKIDEVMRNKFLQSPI